MTFTESTALTGLSRLLESVAPERRIVVVAVFVGAGSVATQWIPQLATLAAVLVALAAIGYLHAYHRSLERAEHQRMQDTFSRYVGEEVAQCALRGGTELGGHEVEVAVLFVDLVDYTGLVSTCTAAEVADLLNEFFRIVVDTVDRHGGFVNKFEGDAVLAVFGAPRVLGDSCGAALVAARDMRDGFVAQFGPHGFGIGVAAGRAFAGHVGTRNRLEYTVIGAPVNEAARLTELAKNEPGHVLASATTIRGASSDEGAAWNLGESVLLRGRTAHTVLARPLAGTASELNALCSTHFDLAAGEQ